MMSLPKCFQHIDFNETGGPDVLKMSSSPMPSIKSHQVLIKVAAAGVNGPDIVQRNGIYPAPSNASAVLGLEVSGIISDVGDQVTDWTIGDHVCALVPGGGYSEYVVTSSSHCLPIPSQLSFIEAAALPETFFTVWGNLFMRAGLKKEETLLIHGASGGLGNCAMLLAKAFGAKVIVTAGNDEKTQHCLDIGADHAFNYHDDMLLSKITQLTMDKGVDVVFDMAAGDFVNLNLKVLKEDGRMVTVALQRGAKANIDIFRLMAKRITWTGSTLRPQPDASKAIIAQQLRKHVWPLFSHKKLTPYINATFPLAEASSAHKLLESGKNKGKIVLNVSKLS
ncbi:MAG: NAD(P)H-quinone oxidoreductase [Parashewanella sp.]